MMMNRLYWISPVNALQKVLGGVIDVPLILAYMALAAIIVATIAAIRKRGRNKIANTAAMLALSALLLLGPGGPYIDLTPGRLITPSAEFLQRWDKARNTALLIRRRDDSLDAHIYTSAFLDRIGATSVAGYRGGRIVSAAEFDESQLMLTIAETTYSLPARQCFVHNPLAAGENGRMFNLETELIQASRNLQRTTALHIYRLAGPKDPQRPDVLYDAMKQLVNINVKPLALANEVPLEAALVVIDNPQEDLTEAEALRLARYLSRGGRLLLLTDYAYAGLPNLGALMSVYGIEPLDGVVFDPLSQMGGRPEYPIPTLTDHVISRTLNAQGRSVLMPLCHALQEMPREGVRVQSLMDTSASSYIQLNAYEHASLEQTSADPNGPFSLAMVSETGLTRLCWIASTDMASTEADLDVGGANQALLRAAMNWLVDELVEPLPAKEME